MPLTVAVVEVEPLMVAPLIVEPLMVAPVIVVPATSSGSEYATPTGVEFALI